MSVVDGGLEWDRIKDLPSYMRRSILSLGKDTFGTCSLVCVDEGCAELFEAGVGLQWFQGVYLHTLLTFDMASGHLMIIHMHCNITSEDEISIFVI